MALCDLRGAVLHRVCVRGVSAKGHELDDAVLDFATLEHCDFSRARCERASFRFTRLRACDLTGVDSAHLREGADVDADEATRATLRVGGRREHEARIGVHESRIARLEGVVETDMKSDVPAVWQLPPFGATDFVGREEQMAELLQVLGVTPAPAPATPARPAVIHAVGGMGGVGKTKLASALVHHPAVARHFALRWWVSGASAAALQGEMTALGRRLGLGDNPTPADVYAWLHKGGRAYLLVIDNVDAPEEVRAHLPSVVADAGRVLLTSRRTDWGARVLEQRVALVNLDVLSEAAALALLASTQGDAARAEAVRADPAARELVREVLGCLPLAVVQVGAVMEEREVGAGEMLRELRRDAARLLADPATAPPTHERPVWVALQASLEVLRARDRGGLAEWLLRMLAFLAPDGTPGVVLRKTVVGSVGRLPARVAWVPKPRRADATPDASPPVTLTDLEPSRLWSPDRAVREAIVRAVEDVESGARRGAAEHAEAVAARCKALRAVMLWHAWAGVMHDEVTAWSLFVEAARAGDWIAQVYVGTERATPAAALVVAENEGRAAASVPAVTPEEKGRWLRDGLAEAERGVERGEAAAIEVVARHCSVGLRDHTRALALYERACAMEHAHAVNGLGYMIGSGQGVEKDERRALGLYERAAAMGLAQAMHNAALCFENGAGTSKDVSRAVVHYERAASLGLGDALVNLGSLYGRGLGVERDERRASELFARAAAAGNSWAKRKVRVLPRADSSGVSATDSDVTVALKLLASLSLIQRDRVEAREACGMAEELRVHRLVQRVVRAELGGVRVTEGAGTGAMRASAGDEEMAWHVCLEAVGTVMADEFRRKDPAGWQKDEQRKRVLAGAMETWAAGVEELATGARERWGGVPMARVEWAMGILANEQSRYPAALAWYDKALRIYRRERGEEDVDVGALYNSMANVLQAQAQYPKALEFYEKALRIKLRQLGEEHVSVADTYNNMALVFVAQAQFPKALEFYERALRIKLLQLGEEHRSVGDTLYNMALLFESLSRPADALAHFRRAEAIYVRTFGEGHSEVTDVRAKIAALAAR